MGIILKPFAMLLLFFYDFAGYGIALILFAIVVKTILFPITLKGKKSMIQMNMLSGKLQQIQKQYGKDRERYNLEVQKLYEREKVNPMGGCLWSMIPLVLLVALYYIIREPLTNFMNLTPDQIGLLADQLNWSTVAVSNGWVSQSAMDSLLEQVSSGEIQYVFQSGAYNQMYLLSLVNEGNLASLQAALGDAGSNLFIMDFSFLGLNLASIPNWQFWSGGMSPQSIGLFLIPLLSTAASFLSMKVSMATNRINNRQPQNDQMERTNKIMMYTMPLMSLWIGFTVPAGLSIYWIAQYLVTMVQELICSKLLKKDYEAARKAAEERERQEKEEEKRRKEEARLERARRIEEEKKNRGKKKPGQKKKDEEPDQEGVNKNDSREGIRAYARGRAYIPGRFGGVTPYSDPDVLYREQLAAFEAAKAKKGKKGTAEQPAKQEEQVKAAEEQQASMEESAAQSADTAALTEAAAPVVEDGSQEAGLDAAEPAEQPDEPQESEAPESEETEDDGEADQDKEV